MPKVICIGEVLWDKLPNGMFLGGAPLNVALSLQHLGLDSIIVSAIGKEELGAVTKEAIRKKGLGTDYLQEVPGATGLVEVEVDEHGIPSYDIKEPAAWDLIEWNEQVKQLAGAADFVVFGSLAQRYLVSRKTIRKLLEHTNGRRVFDVNLRPPYDDREVVKESFYLSDIVKLNEDELRIISGWFEKVFDEKEGVRFLQEKYHLDAVVVTKGEQGALLFNGREFYEHPGVKVRVKDTVGAGDAFLAAFIKGIIAGEEPEKILEFANKIGAYVASRDGATPEIDTDVL